MKTKAADKIKKQSRKKISEAKQVFSMPAVQKGAEAAFFFAAALLLAKSKVLQGVSPFGVALISVSRRKNYFYSAAGAALGYLLFMPQHFAKYAAAAVIVFLGTLALDLAGTKTKPLPPMAITFFALLATGIVTDIKTGGGAADFSLTAAESILGAGGAFFFFRTLNCNLNRLRFKALPISDIVCIIISSALLLMSLSQIEILGLSPARALAAAAVLIIVRYDSELFGLMLALSIGFALSLQSGDTLFLTGAYGFSALLGCLFCQFGTVACAISFSLSFALFTVAFEADFSYFAEAATGCIAVSLLPHFVSNKIQNFFHDGADITPDGSLRQSLVMRLRFASGAMSCISESVNEVRERINDINIQSPQANGSELSKEEYRAKEIINEKTNEIRRVAADQFFSISDMLADLATEFDEAEHFDNIAAGKIRRILSEYEIYPRNISVIEDKFGRIRIEILTAGGESKFNAKSLQTEISKACGRYFSKCRTTHFSDNSMVTFTEKPNFSLEMGFAQHSAEGKLCGDCIKTVNDGKGRSVLIISDGMGKGGRAALDGAMGAGLLSRLLTAGFGFDSALKVVNSALLVKSNDESLATLDCSCIDLFTGKTDIFKAGAPPTYIAKGGKITKCELSSMPAGILRGIEFAKRTAVLSEGDLLLMVSDGITDPGINWLSALLTGCEDMTAQETADAVLRETLNMTKDIREDDMSVIAAKLHRFSE